jgi:hypothetical protein
MTPFVFLLGLGALPLAIATVGAGMGRYLGAAVFFGMLLIVGLGPMFYPRRAGELSRCAGEHLIP